MKGGRTPIHIQRWAPADFQRDEHVEFMLFARDFRSYTFYRQFLDVSFMAGGDLPSEPSRLCACLHMRPADVQHGLAFCLGRLIEEREGRLFQKRVAAEVAEELAFRESQAEHGRLGGRPKKKGYPSDNGKATLSQTLSESESPPAPSASALRLTPIEETPSPSAQSRGKPRPVPEPGDEVLIRFVRGEELQGRVDSWSLTRRFLDELIDAYPGVDVQAEARHARQWLRTHPEKRKTARGMPAFLNGWMEREANSGPRNGGANGRPARQNSQRGSSEGHPTSSPERIAKLRERDRLALWPADDDSETDPAGSGPR